MTDKSGRLRTNPLAYVFALPGGGGIRAEVPLSKRVFELDPEVVALLHFASVPRRRGDLVDWLCSNVELAEAEAASAVAGLVEKDLLVGEEGNRLHALKEEWTRKGWGSAFYYHLWERCYPFVDYSSGDAWDLDFQLMAEYASEAAPPSGYKEYPDAPVVRLEEDNTNLEGAQLEVVLGQDYDQQESRRLEKRQLGALLYWVFGKVGELKRKRFEPLLLKTSPSGGARHPVEAYVLALDVPGVPLGLYHYSVRQHALECIGKQDSVTGLDALFGSGTEDRGSQAVVVMTAYWLRAMWRYRDPRAFRPVLLDLGHLLETLQLVSRGLGVGCEVYHGFQEEQVEDRLGLHSSHESALYCAFLG